MLKVFSPYDRQLVGEVPINDAQSIEKALATATETYLNRKAWLPKYERIAILEKTAALLQEQKQDFIQTAINEGGKPYIDTVVEIERAIQGIKIASTYLQTQHGHEIPMGLTPATTNRWANTIVEPIGPVVAVSAFNHPLNLIVHQVIPALAVGTPVIVKPALTTPMSCIKFVELLRNAGLPENWCNVIVCENELAEKLVTDSRVKFFSFIGSARVGWYLKSKLAHGVGCTLEHGGAAPVIIDHNIAIDDLIPPLIKAGFYHAGQVCVSTQRIYIHSSVYEEFKSKFVAAASKLSVGNPLDNKIDVGPLILPREVERIHQWVEEAEKSGAEILIGGKPLSETCYAVTVVGNPSENAKVTKEEIFGPVVCLYPYDNIENAVSLANSVPYSFQAAIFSHNINTALGIAQQLRGTAVMINDHTAFRCDWMPFGGFDESGIGIGGIPYAMKDYTRQKLVVIKSPNWQA